MVAAVFHEQADAGRVYCGLKEVPLDWECGGEWGTRNKSKFLSS